jgi:hypothetical protein
LNTVADTERIRERLRALSKSLLGARFRAEIAAFIAIGEPPFWARRMATKLGIPENKVASELSRFANDGLLTTVSVDQWDRRRLYAKSPTASLYWQGAYELLERAATDEASRVGTPADIALHAYLEEVHKD